MPPKTSDAKALEAQRDALVESFKELHAVLSKCSRQLEAYSDVLEGIPKASLSQAVLLNAAHTSLATLAALGATPAIPVAPEPVAGKKRKDRVSTDDKPKKPKAKKDPDAPKRPASAYILYQNHVRSDFVAANKGVPYKEILKRISESWQKLDDGSKKTFVDANSKLKLDYESRKNVYDQEKADGAVAHDEVEQPTARPAKPVSASRKAKATVPPPPPPPVTNGHPSSEDDEDDSDEDDDSDEEDDEADDAKQVAKAVDHEENEDEEDDNEADEEEEEESSASSTSTEEEEEQPVKKKMKVAPVEQEIKQAKSTAQPAKPSKAILTASVPVTTEEPTKKKAKKRVQ